MAPLPSPRRAPRALAPSRGRRHDDAVALKHATATTFVFSRLAVGWRTGLILHPRFGRRMMPGGHVEAGESPPEAALREVAEETGLRARLAPPPAAPLPPGPDLRRVAHPWWIMEHPVPADNHLAEPHVHVDHLYVALGAGPAPGARPAHPFGWYAAADLPGLPMFDDARALALALLNALESAGDPTAGDGEAGPPRGPAVPRTGRRAPGAPAPAAGGETPAGLAAALLSALRA